MKRFFNFLLLWGLLAAGLMGVIGSGGGDDSSGGGSSTPTVCNDSLAGAWQFTENGSGCDDSWTEHNTYTVTQDGCTIQVTTPSGKFNGVVNGDTVSWKGSYPDSGGTTTITSMYLTISRDSITGVANWTWTDGSSTCSGSTQLSGTRST